MKKTLIFASIACAGAFALHADWTCQNWFKGIGASPSGTDLPTSLDPVNGSWAAVPKTPGGDFDGDLSLDANKLVFDLEDGEHLDFTIGSTDPADTGTITDVEVTGVFTPLTGTKPDDETMNGRNAQVGFVVEINGDATNYCAWTGSGWVALTNEAVDAGANVDAETSLLVRFDYRSSPTASFAILTGSTPVVTNFLGNSDGLVALPITAAAVSVGRVQGVSCYGSGTLAKADGGVGLGIADVNGVKYGSLQDAIDNATSGQCVTVLKQTSESVTTKDGVEIEITDPNGYAAAATINVPAGNTVAVLPTPTEINNGASGSCTVPLNVVASSADQVVIDLGSAADYKEIINKSISGSSLTFDLRTKTEIITNAAPGGKALERNPEKLHGFLAQQSEYIGTAYTKANPTTGDIADALLTTVSGRPLWQSYVLDIAPTDSIAPVTTPAGDTDPSHITLAIPAITNAVGSGDYEIKYRVGSEELQSNPGAIQVPITSSGTYEIKINLH